MRIIEGTAEECAAFVDELQKRQTVKFELKFDGESIAKSVQKAIRGIVEDKEGKD